MMSNRELKKIYLAGPITGCNPEQKIFWRQTVKAQWGQEFDFIDPVEQIQEAKSAYDVIEADMKAIEEADAVIANMWKESIGTSIGVFLAKSSGCPVVVIDKNRLGSTTLAWWADAVVLSEEAAINYLKDHFRRQYRIEQIEKRDGRIEEFDTKKLNKSICKACRAANITRDVLIAAEIVPEVIRKLLTKKTDSRVIKSAKVKEAVWEVLGELETNPQRYQNFQGIREAWEKYDSERKTPASQVVLKTDVLILPKPSSDVKIYSGKKPHKLLWGKMLIKSVEDIPSSAKPLFREICRVSGIAEIKFSMIQEGTYDGKCKAEISADTNESYIKGSCFDKGKYGGRQFFRIKVKEPYMRNQVLRALFNHLLENGYLKHWEGNPFQVA